MERVYKAKELNFDLTKFRAKIKGDAKAKKHYETHQEIAGAMVAIRSERQAKKVAAEQAKIQNMKAGDLAEF